jgi:phosphoribosylamine--glycine ligase
MNILIVGSGGREHALAWKIAQSSQVTHIWAAPGNAGSALEHKVKNVPIVATDIEKLLDFAKAQAIDLTIVGPEAPLALGIVNRFQQNGLSCFGPTQQAAQLETSKAFSKAFMLRHHIPTAAYQTFNHFEQASKWINQQSFPIVIKEDGLAAGKGVVIAHSLSEALTALKTMLQSEKTVVIEEFLPGEEASFIVMTDGRCILPLATSQDHKAIGEGDIGANTGGMGAYSPAPIVTNALHDAIMDMVIKPTIEGMAKEGICYQGFLYAGLMITQQGDIKVLEYNCRLGDPEAEVILPRLQSDLATLCQATVDKTLQNYTAVWDPRPALGVILAMQGYPGEYSKGAVIAGLDAAISHDQKIFHAGTESKDGKIVTNGGRVLCVTAIGDSIQKAQARAYDCVDKIHWKGKYYRRDIGHRAVSKANT